MSDSDDDLKRAIALSLTSEAGSNGYIDLVSDDDEEEPRFTTAANVQPSVQRRTHKAIIDLSEPSPSSHQAAAKIAPTTSVFGGDRKQMEEERLARAALRKISPVAATPTSKRRASTSPLRDKSRQKTLATNMKRKDRDSQNDTPALLDARPHETPQSGNNAFESRELHAIDQKIPSPDIRHKMTEITNVQVALSGVQYPDGVVKKTWAFGYDRQGDDIKIEEVFQKTDLELAVLCTFQLDADCRYLGGHVSLTLSRGICVPRDPFASRAFCIEQLLSPPLL